MIFVGGAGLRWLWFVSCYGVTLLGSVMAFLDDRSLFSMANKGREIIDSYSGGIASQFLEKASRNVPSVWSYVSFSFYLFVVAMLFCGYWALAGKYREQGLLNQS